jgi:glyoxylase-like metal-dependent hydrolase (beta-lactamase superfamily II)
MPAHATPSRSFSGEGNAEAGVSPESADYVMCTHLHVDHCGWDIRLLDGRWVPMFLTRSTCSLRPNTSTGMDRRERRARVYQDSVLAVIESGQAEIIDGQGAVGDRLMLHPTPGANSWPCGHKAPNRVFGGDLMHQPLQVFRPGWNSEFCENPVRARDSRRRLLERAAETLPRFNSRNGRRSSSKELPGGAVNVHPPNNAYPRIGRAGPGLAGPGKSSPWISSRQ